MTKSVPSGGAWRILPRIPLLAMLAAQFLAPATAPAMVLGADDRNQAAAFLSSADEDRFQGLGRIECLQPGSRGLSFHATGWIVGSADTVMTAAHIFFEQDWRGDRSIERDPANCIFVLFNRDQSIREIANIRYAVSPWADRQVRGDSARDYAVLKLANPVRVSNIPAVSVNAAIRPDVQLVAFQTGVLDSQRARITRGEARRFPVLDAHYELEGMHVSNSTRLFSTSANSSPGSSGGLYYDRRSATVLGLHLGSMCDPAALSPSYDPDHCFNYGLRFDRDASIAIDAVARDAAPRNLMIRPNQPAPATAAIVLALAS